MFIDLANIASVCGTVAFHSFLWFVGVLFLFLVIVIAECAISGVDNIDINTKDSIPKSFLKAKLPGLAIISLPFLYAIQILGWIMVVSFSVWFSLAVLY